MYGSIQPQDHVGNQLSETCMWNTQLKYVN